MLAELSVATEIEQIESRLASELAEDALLADIEATLRRLRMRYRQDSSLFNPKIVDQLQHLRRLASGLRLFINLLDRWGDISDRNSFEVARAELGALLDLFTGMPVHARIARQQDALLAIEPMIAGYDPSPSGAPAKGKFTL